MFREANPDVLTVVDTEIDEGVAWRAIRFDSIQAFFVTDLPILEYCKDEVA